MRINFLFKSTAIFTIALLLFIGACMHGDRDLISKAMAVLCCTFGTLVGLWIGKKKKINPNPKLIKELFLFYGLAIVLSAIWFFSWDGGNIQWIGVALIFLISLIVVAIRNNVLKKIINKGNEQNKNSF